MRLNDTKISNSIKNAIDSLGKLIDVDTVIGTPISTKDGDYIIPFSKVTVAYLVGGGEYGKLTLFNSAKNLPHTAGNGAIVSVKPSGFIVKDKDDNYKILSVLETSCEKIIDKSCQFFDEYLSKLYEKDK